MRVIEVPRGGPGPGTQLLTGKYKVKTDQLFDDGLRFGKQLLLFRRILSAKKLCMSPNPDKGEICISGPTGPPTPERFVQQKWRHGNIHNVYHTSEAAHSNGAAVMSPISPSYIYVVGRNLGSG